MLSCLLCRLTLGSMEDEERRARAQREQLERDVASQERGPRNVGKPRKNGVLSRALRAAYVGPPQQLEWDPVYKIPIGKFRSEFASWLGFVARRTVPCTVIH